MFATVLLCAVYGNDAFSAAVFLQLALSQGFSRVRLRESGCHHKRCVCRRLAMLDRGADWVVLLKIMGKSYRVSRALRTRPTTSLESTT